MSTSASSSSAAAIAAAIYDSKDDGREQVSDVIHDTTDDVDDDVNNNNVSNKEDKEMDEDIFWGAAREIMNQSNKMNRDGHHGRTLTHNHNTRQTQHTSYTTTKKMSRRPTPSGFALSLHG
jgi:hypothetical protein